MHCERLRSQTLTPTQKQFHGISFYSVSHHYREVRAALGLDKKLQAPQAAPRWNPCQCSSYRRTPLPIKRTYPNHSLIMAESGRRSSAAVMPPIESLVLEQVLALVLDIKEHPQVQRRRPSHTLPRAYAKPQPSTSIQIIPILCRQEVHDGNRQSRSGTARSLDNHHHNYNNAIPIRSPNTRTAKGPCPVRVSRSFPPRHPRANPSPPASSRRTMTSSPLTPR